MRILKNIFNMILCSMLFTYILYMGFCVYKTGELAAIIIDKIEKGILK